MLQLLRNSTLLFTALLLLLVLVHAQCPDYADYSRQYHAPFSTGRYNLSYQRPSPACRTFVIPAVDDTVTRLQSTIKDPDLYRLFQNSFPNTLDTAIKWKGYAANDSTEELTFVITGDINAMWLRDSANQMQSYLSLLEPSDSPNSLASLYRGVINLQSRYILTSPYCNSFQPPVESLIPPAVNGAATSDDVHPPYTNTSVFECKYELDSLAAFLEISYNYHLATSDTAFFTRYSWLPTIRTILSLAYAMQTPTYAANGSVLASPYTFRRETTSATETLPNSGAGSPVSNTTGLIRSAFRPSDDATTYQLLIPANMMFARYLSACADIACLLPDPSAEPLATEMRKLATSLRIAISAHAIVKNPDTDSQVYAYELDGYGSRAIMDDANIPSLLAAPFFGYLDAADPVYLATRQLILSADNPYYMRGPVISAVGGPHDGPGYAWPMANIVRILTSEDQGEVVGVLRELVASTDGLGLVHESINSFNASDWTRQW